MSELSLRTSAIPVTDPEAGLRLTEIFYSLQGEALTSGLPTIFVRLTGCPLRCVYCDTEYAFSGGDRQSLEAIIATIKSYPCQRICLTGGEPLAQPNASAEFSWFLAYLFASAGAILGFCFGARSGEFFAQIFANDDKGPSKASSELIRLIAKTLLVAAIIWSIFLIFLS